MSRPIHGDRPTARPAWRPRRTVAMLTLAALLGVAGCGSASGDIDASDTAPSSLQEETESVESTTSVPEAFYGNTFEEACLGEYDPAAPRPSAESFAVLPTSTDDLLVICVGPVLLTAAALETADATGDTYAEQIDLVFPPDGIEQFNAAAKLCFDQSDACPSQRLAVVLNGQIITSPNIQSPSFEADQIQISGSFTPAETQLIAKQIRQSIAGDTNALRFRPVIFERGPGPVDYNPPPTTTAPAFVAEALCPEIEGSDIRPPTFESAVPMCIDTTHEYSAEIQTSLGTMTIDLYPELAPKTVNNFVTLARYRFYDGLTFHRIIDEFVIQGGDPAGTGTGGPGYTFEDELPAEGTYQIGSLAMANSGPDTNGSQFFIVSGEDGTTLAPDYSLFGQVVDGLDVLEAIQTVSTDDRDYPLTTVLIESITITERPN